MPDFEIRNEKWHCKEIDEGKYLLTVGEGKKQRTIELTFEELRALSAIIVQTVRTKEGW